jgi:hypothetical protein
MASIPAPNAVPERIKELPNNFIFKKTTSSDPNNFSLDCK